MNCHLIFVSLKFRCVSASPYKCTSCTGSLLCKTLNITVDKLASLLCFEYVPSSSQGQILAILFEVCGDFLHSLQYNCQNMLN